MLLPYRYRRPPITDEQTAQVDRYTCMPLPPIGRQRHKVLETVIRPIFSVLIGLSWEIYYVCCSRGGRSRPLPARAVSILRSWYEDNRDHPYVDGAEAAALAAHCQLSVAQLRKWLANRRLRTNSTKHIAEVVNRRRLKSAARRRQPAGARENDNADWSL